MVLPFHILTLFSIYCLYLELCLGKIAIPYGKNQGDSLLGDGDDENFMVNLKSPVRFWDKDVQQLHISFNGGILSKEYTRMASSDPWSLFPEYSVFPFWEDLVVNSKDGAGSVYYNNSVTSENLNIIESIISKIKDFETDLSFMSFEADSNRTLVVTYDRVKDFDKTVENTFQIVLTTNTESTQTYMIFSYENLDGPNKGFFPKVGFVTNKNNICMLPGSGSLQALQLTCRSNIYMPGVFVVGLTPKSAMKCSQGSIPYTCSHCNFDSAIPDTCYTSMVDEPRCGSNNISYDNICELRKDLCKSNGTFAISKVCTICDSKTCIHGTCHKQNCVCSKGYTGKFCHLDIDECNDNNGGCDHNCKNTVGGHTCFCRSGYKISDVDGRSCIKTTSCSAADSCEQYTNMFCQQTWLSSDCKLKCEQCLRKVCTILNGGCEDVCIPNTNTTGRTCQCYNSKLKDDDQSCVQQYIYYGSGNTLVLSPSQTNNFPAISFVLGIDHIINQEKLIWIGYKTGDTGSTLNLASFNDLSQNVELYKSGTYIEDLSFDPTTGNVYVTEPSTKSVSVILDALSAGNTGGGLTKIKLIDVNLPRAIIYEPCNKYLFISDIGEPAIIRMEEDRTVKEIVSKRLDTPNALAIDQIGKKIYWGDAVHDKIERSNYDGSCREVIYFTDPNNDEEDDSHIYGLVYNNGFLYWTDWITDSNQQHSIHQLDITNAVTSVYTKVTSRPHNIGFIKYNKYHCTNTSTCATPNPPSQIPLGNETCYLYGPLLDKELPRNDDLIEGEIKLSRNISLLTHKVNKIFVNVNGYITFANNLEEYEIELPYTESILSIFHADYSTEHAGHIYYREITSFDFLQQISNDINQYYNTYNAFRAEHVVLVTWENVPLVEDKNKRNTFQVAIASDNQRTFAIYCFKRLENEGTVGFYNDNNKCSVKSSSKALDLLKRGKIIYNLTPDQCNTNLTQSLNELLPYGENVGDTKKTISSQDEVYQLDMGSNTKFLTSTTNKFHIQSNGKIYGEDITDGYISTYTLNWIRGQIYYRVSTRAQDLNQISKDLLKYLGKDLLSSMTFKKIAIVTFVGMSLHQGGQQQNTYQFIHISNDQESYGIFKFQMLTSAQAVSGIFGGVCNQRLLIHSSTQQSTVLMFESNIGSSRTFVYKLSTRDCSLSNATFLFAQQNILINETTTSASHVTLQNTKTEAVIIDTVSGSEPTFVIRSGKSELHNTKGEVILFNLISFSHAKKTTRMVNVMGIPEKASSSIYVAYGQVKIPMFGGKTGTKHVHFEREMLSTPVVKLTNRLKEQVTLQNEIVKNSAISWLRNVDRFGFDVCFKELFTLSGHREMIIDYVSVSLNQDFTESNSYDFGNLLKVGFNSHNASVDPHCGVVKFNFKYHDIPKVFVTAEDRTPDSANAEKPIIYAWLKSVYHDHSVVCARSSMDNLQKVRIHVLAKGSFDICSSFKCPGNLQCQVDKQTISPFCGCITSCPVEDVGDWFCASNFISYKSECEMHQKTCKKYGADNVGNFTKVHNGRCQHLPYTSGTTILKAVPDIPSVFCTYVPLPSFYFDQFAKINVVLTTNWNYSMEADKTHNAAAVWSEDVTIQGFTACAMVSGRIFDDKEADSPSVNWMAYQSESLKDVSSGKLDGGAVEMPVWYTGSRCVDIPLQDKTRAPNFFVSVQHLESRTYRNAMTVWVEQYQLPGGKPTSYRACARELQNFDGIHRGIKVNWLAVHDTIQVDVSEKGSIFFGETANGEPIAARCKMLEYNKEYPSITDLVIMLSPQNMTTLHSTIDSGYSDKDIVSWIESNNRTHLKVCLKSIRAGRLQQPLMLSYVVLPTKGLCEDGWYYHNGHCFQLLESPAISFDDAKNQCASQNANLVEVDSVERNHFISLLTKTSNVWLGYTFTAGRWQWLSASAFTFTNWFDGQPGSVGQQCSAMVVGTDQNGMSIKQWNNVSCTSKQQVVCQKRSTVLDEACPLYCLNGAECQNPAGITESVVCKCKQGFAGKRCEVDVSQHNECSQYESLVNQTWRLSYLNNNNTKSINETCDRSFATNQSAWYRFTGSSGIKLLENTCINHFQFCGVKYPGWLAGQHPSIYDGSVDLNIHFYSTYCASDQGRVRIRNCGHFYVYKFLSLPYWSCNYGLCTVE